MRAAISCLIIFGLIRTALPDSYTTISAGVDVQDKDFLNEMVLSYNERMVSCFRSAVTSNYYKAGTACAYAANWDKYQSNLDAEKDRFINLNDFPDSDISDSQYGNRVTYYDWGDVASAASVDPSGWRRSSSIWLIWDNYTPGLASYGTCQSGDYWGPWIFEDMRRVMSAYTATYRQTGISHSSPHYLKSVGQSVGFASAMSDATDNWPGTWQSGSDGMPQSVWGKFIDIDRASTGGTIDLTWDFGGTYADRLLVTVHNGGSATTVYDTGTVSSSGSASPSVGSGFEWLRFQLFQGVAGTIWAFTATGTVGDVSIEISTNGTDAGGCDLQYDIATYTITQREWVDVATIGSIPTKNSCSVRFYGKVAKNGASDSVWFDDWSGDTYVDTANRHLYETLSSASTSSRSTTDRHLASASSRPSPISQYTGDTTAPVSSVEVSGYYDLGETVYEWDFTYE